MFIFLSWDQFFDHWDSLDSIRPQFTKDHSRRFIHDYRCICVCFVAWKTNFPVWVLISFAACTIVTGEMQLTGALVPNKLFPFSEFVNWILSHLQLKVRCSISVALKKNFCQVVKKVDRIRWVSYQSINTLQLLSWENKMIIKHTPCCFTYFLYAWRLKALWRCQVKMKLWHTTSQVDRFYS